MILDKQGWGQLKIVIICNYGAAIIINYLFCFLIFASLFITMITA
jgi:hypothetical protein